jgi:hypothetical protein
MATRKGRRAGYRRGKPRRAKRRTGRGGGQLGPVLVACALILAAVVGFRAFRDRLGGGPTRPHLSMREARAFNSSVPFVSGSLRAARPFRFHGTPAARLQARECLATAALYEVGEDERGQRAVMQVVLNRVRAPGFPKTVCGVVYQGSGRSTGCQFSFTCDGSLTRRRQRSGWAGARKRATRALSGAVFRPVGTATHYHADWMVPYWMGSLDKLAQVRSHIFYRAQR